LNCRDNFGWIDRLGQSSWRCKPWKSVMEKLKALWLNCRNKKNECGFDGGSPTSLVAKWS
jgi:hypothetical protein